MNGKIRPARPDDDSFLARVMLMAARAHVGRSVWDLIVGGTEDDCLAFLKLSATTEQPHPWHYSNFLVMEAGGRPVSALAGYDPELIGAHVYNREFPRIAKKFGWSEAEAEAALKRAAPCNTCNSKTAPGAWVIENVATLPEMRRQGLMDALLERILDEGKKRGFKRSQIGVHIGNTPAQRAYEKHGFRFVDEKRHPDFEAAIGCPGLARLMREL